MNTLNTANVQFPPAPGRRNLDPPSEAGRRVARLVARIDGVLLRALASVPGELSRATLHLGGAGGKRLRPRLVLLSAFASGTRRRGLLRLATAAEVVHSATLLHDDVIDEAPERRGRPSVPAAFGNSRAVLAGDHLFALAMDLVLGSGVHRALPLLLQAIQNMVQAESVQLDLRRDPRADEETCTTIALGKTASLFTWCAAAGAMAAGATAAHEAALVGYAREVGIAFQLADDLDDLGDATRVGEDLAQGAVTLPIVLACEERPRLLRLVRAAVRPGPLARRARAARAVTSAVLASRGPQRTAERVRRHVDSALAYLGRLPDGPWRDELARAARTIVKKEDE